MGQCGVIRLVTAETADQVASLCFDVYKYKESCWLSFVTSAVAERETWLNYTERISLKLHCF